MRILRNWIPRDGRERRAAILAVGGIVVAVIGIFSADTGGLFTWGLILILAAYRISLNFARRVASFDE